MSSDSYDYTGILDASMWGVSSLTTRMLRCPAVMRAGSNEFSRRKVGLSAPGDFACFGENCKSPHD
ncbi:hypothetical protein SBA5_70014 [Candidatus Sulfotelmatomonas gaucii]|uniref:Uncharacterized protein n=1 Tax=Candidatus Sulfuritelmatomonas gaucii TaxID=2043161 RepID=A0A2N9M097_9BACT|nr:hypothetical protein SBA5_70014 [Candidatus Sulfotelmatomonas gaucii]